MLGHSERDCAIVYANPYKVIEKAYGTWLRAPTKNTRNRNAGARWLRNGGEENQHWGSTIDSTTAHGGDQAVARFMEVDGRLNEIEGDVGEISVVTRHNSIKEVKNKAEISVGQQIRGNKNADQLVITKSKKKDWMRR